MKTVILSGVSQRGKMKILRHGQVWEILEEHMGRFLLKSSGMTFHEGDGIMGHDWRFVQIHGDKDFKIDFGKGQVKQAPKIAQTLLPEDRVTLLEALQNDTQALNKAMQSLKGNRKRLV